MRPQGVKATFSGVLGIRQAHGFAFGKSDLFFLCALSPEPSELPQALTAQVWEAAGRLSSTLLAF